MQGSPWITRARWTASCLFALSVLVAACDEKTAPCTVTEVVVSPSASTIAQGESSTLTVETEDENCDPVPDAEWSSSAPTIASVNSSGTVTGISVGPALITATVDGVEGSAAVNIIPPPVSTVVVTPGTASVAVGAALPLSAVTRDAQGQILTGRTVTWTVSPAGFASVGNTSGVVTGLAVGTAIVTATSEGKTGTAIITVTQAPVNNITVSAPTTTMTIGAFQLPTAVLRDVAGNVLTGRTIVWSSTAPAILLVDPSTGFMLAQAGGIASVVATSEGVAGSLSITVAQVPVASVTVTVPSLTMAPATAQQATATLRDAANQVLTGRVITWFSSAPTVAQVSATGVVTALTTGFATITATSEGISGAVGITVTGGAPTLTSITPSFVSSVFSSVAATLTGTNFEASGTTLTFTPAVITPTGVVVQSATTLTSTLGIPGGFTAAVFANVTVTTVAGTSNVVGFTVFPPGTAPAVLNGSNGGLGGAAYTLDCSLANEVATGFDVRAGVNLDQIMVRCQPVTTAARTFGAVRNTPAAGGAGGVASSLTCPANSVMTGITGRTGTLAAATVIGQLAALCTPISGGPAAPTATVGTVQGGSTAFTSVCPAGLAVTSIQGGASTVVERIAIVCR